MDSSTENTGSGNDIRLEKVKTSIEETTTRKEGRLRLRSPAGASFKSGSTKGKSDQTRPTRNPAKGKKEKEKR